MPNTTCRGCGDPLTPKGHHGGPPKVWCSPACQARWRRANDPAYRAREATRKAKAPWRAPRYTDHQREARRKLRNAKRGTRATYTWAMGWCETCGEQFTARWVGEPPRYCTPRCGMSAKAKRFRVSGGAAEADQRRRARKKAAFVAPVSRMATFERDQWTCQLCGERLVRTATVPDPLAPTIDHIIPLAKGGTHEPGNVQAAHFLCNSRKGDRVDSSASDGHAA